MKFFSENAYIVRFSRIRLFDGNSYFIPEESRHRPACQALIKGKYFEPLTHRLVALTFKLRPGNIIHAGTFYGDMVPSFSRICGPDHRLYAFEPLLENYVLARGAVDANDLRNVVLIGSALGEKTDICFMDNTLIDRPDLHAGGASRVAPEGKTSASMVSIDSLGLKDISVLHLDVEGFELPALRGGERTIRECRPAIFIEDNNDDCTPFLTGLDYVRLGRTPALNVWYPKENTDLRDAITEARIVQSPGKGK